MEKEWREYQVKPREGKSPVVSIPEVLEAEGQGGGGGERVSAGGGRRCLGDEALTWLKSNPGGLLTVLHVAFNIPVFYKISFILCQIHLKGNVFSAWHVHTPVILRTGFECCVPCIVGSKLLNCLANVVFPLMLFNMSYHLVQVNITF